MGMDKEMVDQGNWLFRWRSYVPIAFVAPLAIGVATMHWPFNSYALHEKLEFVCMAISILGVLVRVMTIAHTPAGTSGRNTHGQVAEHLNTSGIYSMVRHPLYLGNFLIGLGVIMVPMQPWLIGLYVLMFWLYYERIMMAEEDFLRQKFGEAFDQWAKQTPAFIPNPLGWTKPELPFSLRNVLKREYTAVALVVLCHALVETLEHLVIEHRFKLEVMWACCLAFTMMAYFFLRHLKKHTTLLHVEGR